MAKFLKKVMAQKLRKSGNSIKDIAGLLKVSKSSASQWCRDIKLTNEQINFLNNKMKNSGYWGRLKGALLQKEKRQRKIQKYITEGSKEVSQLSSRDWLMLGLGLYLGEGGKGRQFQFSNSNPKIIKLIIIWLEKIFKIKKEEFILRFAINKIHKKRELIIKNFWSKFISISQDQFRKTTIIKSKNKKVYKNFDNYFGVLTIRLRKSTDLQCKINGLNYGIFEQAA